MELGFSSANWMTCRQAKELAVTSFKGEKGSLVVYADLLRAFDEVQIDRSRETPDLMKAFTKVAKIKIVAIKNPASQKAGVIHRDQNFRTCGSENATAILTDVVSCFGL